MIGWLLYCLLGVLVNIRAMRMFFRRCEKRYRCGPIKWNARDWMMVFVGLPAWPAIGALEEWVDYQFWERNSDEVTF